jgi:hypothetical protein
MNATVRLEQGDAFATATKPTCGGMIVTLRNGQSALLQLRAPAEIRCLRGLLWITRSPETADTVLQAGQRQAVMGAGAELVLSSTARSRPVTVEIVPAGLLHAGFWARLKRALTGRRSHFRMEIA